MRVHLHLKLPTLSPDRKTQSSRVLPWEVKLQHRKICNSCPNKQAISERQLCLQSPARPQQQQGPVGAAVPCFSSSALRTGCCSRAVSRAALSSSDSGASVTQGRCTPSNSEGLRRALLPPRTETTKSQLRREALSLFRCEALSQWNFLHSRPGIYLGGNVNDSRAEPIQFIYRHVLRWLWSVTDLETHCSVRTLAGSYFYATIKFPVLWPHPGFVPWPYTCSEWQPPSWGKNLKPLSLLPKPVSSLRKGSKSG